MDVLARYSYDDYSPANAQWGRGLRTGMIDGSGSTSWRYDAGGRLNLEQKSITGSGTYSTRWGYNAGGQLAWMQYPGASAEKVTYSYHPQMALNGVTGSGTYVQSMRYDAAGRMTQIVRGAGTLTSSYSYYGWTETAQVGDEHLFQGARLKQATTGGLQNLSYLYDEAGNVVRILDAVNSSQKQCFQYDILDRLTQATTYNNPGLGCTAQVGNGNYHQNYSYNPDTGNLLSKDGTGTYNYDDGNHKHAVTHLGEVQKHWYDLNGNMTTRVAGATTYTQGWDAENRLVSVSGGGLNSTFGYDGDGTRVKGVVAGATTAYVGNWFEWTGSTSTMKKYYYAGSQRIASEAAAGRGQAACCGCSATISAAPPRSPTTTARSIASGATVPGDTFCQ